MFPGDRVNLDVAETTALRCLAVNRYDDFRRLHGHGRGAVPLLHRLCRARVHLRPALCRQFNTQDLTAFGLTELPAATCAAGALIEYARATQGNAIAHVTALAVENTSAYIALDPATRRNLEISETLRGEPAPTLLSLLDTCATSMGSRLLRHTLHHPLKRWVCS